jgi:hypothetical protein
VVPPVAVPPGFFDDLNACKGHDCTPRWI